MQATTGSASALKRHRETYAAAHTELSGKLKQGTPGAFVTVDVTRTDANGVQTVERYGDVCLQPSKKAAKLGTSPSPTQPYEIYRSKPFGARAVFSNTFGGTTAYLKLLAKLGLQPKTNYDQSLVNHYFKRYMNQLEKNMIVPGSTAANLLPGFKTFVAFAKKAKALLAAGDDEAEEEGEAEADVEVE